MKKPIMRMRAASWNIDGDINHQAWHMNTPDLSACQQSWQYDEDDEQWYCCYTPPTVDNCGYFVDNYWHKVGSKNIDIGDLDE